MDLLNFLVSEKWGSKVYLNPLINIKLKAIPLLCNPFSKFLHFYRISLQMHWNKGFFNFQGQMPKPGLLQKYDLMSLQEVVESVR